ncbi:MAG: TolC family protein [Candidatus Omnitrophica bacterium]|nr:TolC family protein [Candidatus Omnitrophota bacterium]
MIVRCFYFREKKEKIKMRKFFVLPLIFSLFSGCLISPTKVEKEEQEKLTRVENIYRPEEKKPILPVLKEDSELKDFIQYALLNNPEVEASFYDWKSAVEKISATRYLPYPILSLENEIVSNSVSLSSGLMLMLPAKDKITLASEAMSLEARKKRKIFEEKILKVAFNVKNLSYQYWVLKEKIKLTENILKILNEIEELILARLKVGKASQSDVLAIQIEEEKIRNMLLDLDDYKKVLLAKFGAILGIPPKDKIPEPPEKLPFTEQDFSEEKIWELVKLQNPKLSFMKDEIEESEVFVKLAYKEYLPDFSIGLMKSFFSEMAMVKPMLTLSVPWRKKISSMVVSAKSKVKMTKAQYTTEELDLAVMLADGLFRWRQANREFKLYKENLLPKVKWILELNKVGYITGLSNLVDFFVSERMFLDYSFNYLSAQAFREIALNEVSIIIAGILPERETLLQEAR